MFTVAFVFVPVIRRGIDSPKEVARLVAMVVQRFQRISREVVFLILLTGIFNLINAGVARGFDFSATYIRMLVIKVALFIVIIAIQTWQSFRLVPAYSAITSDMEQAVDTASGAFKRLHRRALMTSILSLVLAASVILLGLALRYR